LIYVKANFVDWKGNIIPLDPESKNIIREVKQLQKYIHDSKKASSKINPTP